ncbi:MAG: flagellar hook-length control protein FliK, partial [Brevundimonas sp.]
DPPTPPQIGSAQSPAAVTPALATSDVIATAAKAPVPATADETTGTTRPTQTTDAAETAKAVEAKAPAASAAPPAAPQPAPPPLRALAERTSRPLDPPADKAAGASASPSAAAAAGTGQPSASATQTVPDRPAGPETAPKSAAEIASDSSAPSIDAAPAAENAASSSATTAQARETSLSGLSRATIDATAQIAAQILRKLEGRSTRFEMALTPDDLGRVDVKLDIDSEGRLAARLAFDNPVAATDLRGRVDDLRRELEDAGFHMADDAFEFAERDRGSSSFDRGQDARQGQNRAFAAASRLNAEIDVAQPPRWLALTLSPVGVDLKV